MLSYFLFGAGNESNNNNNNRGNGNAHSGGSGASGSAGYGDNATGQPGLASFSTASSEANHYASAGAVNMALDRGPPSTPAVHFYTSTPKPPQHHIPQHQQQHPHQPQQHQHPLPASVVSTSSSSSSLSSMAATLVSGGPVMQQYAAQQQQSQPQNAQQQHSQPQQPEHSSGASNTASAATASIGTAGPTGSTTTPPSSISPISPAATIGSAQEHLMLPPPPREKSEAEQQKHKAWLQHINDRARMSTTQGQQPPGQQQHQQNQQQPQQPGVVVPGMPAPHGYPTALAPNPVYQPGMVMAQQAPFHPPHHPHHHMISAVAAATVATAQPAESKEKRLRRLARNRESAKKSRRRKKERLENLAEKVNKLHGKIEEERRKKLNEMEENLQKTRLEAIAELQNENNMSEQEWMQRLYTVMQATSPSCPVRQNTISFQYSTLKQTITPTYREFILWLTTQPESFFTAGKSDRAKTEPPGASAKTPTARISSKQIGDDLYSQWKKEKKASPSPAVDDKDAPPPELRIPSTDAARLWPLFCYEMSVSVEQEEKMLQFHKRATQETPGLPAGRSHVHRASRLVTTLQRGLMIHSHSTTARTENTLLRNLTPEQSTRFLGWFAKNKGRCKEAVRQQQDKRDESLTEICERLDHALRLPPTPSNTNVSSTPAPMGESSLTF